MDVDRAEAAAHTLDCTSPECTGYDVDAVGMRAKCMKCATFGNPERKGINAFIGGITDALLLKETPDQKWETGAMVESSNLTHSAGNELTFFDTQSEAAAQDWMGDAAHNMLFTFGFATQHLRPFYEAISQVNDQSARLLTMTDRTAANNDIKLVQKLQRWKALIDLKKQKSIEVDSIRSMGKNGIEIREEFSLLTIQARSWFYQENAPSTKCLGMMLGENTILPRDCDLSGVIDYNRGLINDFDHSNFEGGFCEPLPEIPATLSFCHEVESKTDCEVVKECRWNSINKKNAGLNMVSMKMNSDVGANV